ncbi:MAG: divalent metal cation transporter [Gemmatimonadetes bacterium]|nr:divalent metal cation transporter [Gemmatimonadota bacterium]
MATSAIGPGFLTQTAAFTAQLGASFGFAILLSVLFDLGAQLNIWRVLTVSGRRAQDVANDVVPGLGHALAFLVVLGGLAFNVGNVAGAGLGLNVVFGVDVRAGAALSALLAIAIFLVKEVGRAMDRFTVALGFVMVALAGYVAIASAPPVGEAVLRSVVPERIAPLSIVTIVGGTVGGYITFAGAHRLLDAGVTGPGALRHVTQSATSAIVIASLMRVVLFLGALGVVSQGLALDPQNPPASVFRHAAGEAGFRVFGVVMWSAAITSVVGSAYTSVSFLRGLLPRVDERWARLVIAFIVVSTLIFVTVGRPVKVLILVGALNGLILPLSLGTMLVAAHRQSVVGAYRHPAALTVGGALVTLAMAWLSVQTLIHEVPAFLK